MKILSGGNSSQVIAQLQRYKLLIYILPSISTHPHFEEVLISLQNLDDKMRNSSKKKDKKQIYRSDMILAMIQPIVTITKDEFENEKEYYQRVYRMVKESIAPITPANYDVEHAAAEIVKKSGITVLSSWMKARKPIVRQPRVQKKNGGKKGRYPKMKNPSQPNPNRQKQHKRTQTP